MFDLRYYQNELIAGARAAWRTYQSTAIISATATGKTEMYMALAVAEPGRVLVLVHRDYLIGQPVQRLARAGFTDVAVEKAERRSETSHRKAKIVFASVQSIGPESQLHRLRSFDPKEFSLVIIDEGHRGTAVTYRRVLSYFCANLACKVLVLTATPKRKDGIALDNICESVAGVYGPSAAMAEGWIPPVKFYRRDVASLDFRGVKLKGTDLDPEEVQRRLMEEKPLHEVCASLTEDRGPTIIFCPLVLVAQAYCELMDKRYRPGRARVLSEETGEEEREWVGKMLAQGEIDYVFNVNIVTEGYDLPSLLRVVWAAPTASLVRYTQGVGRVFRTHHSLRDHLKGSREEAQERKLLIEQSPKPFGIVVTYYPQNCAHELCDPVDILGGDDLPPDVKAAAKQVQEETSKQGRGSTTDEDIETAKVFVDLRSIVDRRLKELKARADFADKRFDPMSGRRQAAGNKDTASVRQAAGEWPDGDPMSDKQRGWFRWKNIAMPDGATRFRAVVVRDLIDLGVAPETAWGWGKRQALKVRGELQLRKEVAGHDAF
jgi:superfamily II DNA or RNA helicase